MMGDLVGQQGDKYQLIELLGRGAVSEVHRGRQSRLGMEVAIKLWQTHLPGEISEQFQQEIRAIAVLNHSNIVRMLDCGVVDGQPFLVMDYAPKGSLRQWFLPGRQREPALLVPFVRQIAEALHYAHEQGMVHRNLKPENVLLGQNNEVLLSDFGMTSLSSLSDQNIQAAAAAIAYVAPEQQKQAIPASDQYALAVMIYEWLTGSPLFQGSAQEIARQQREMPPPLRQKVPTLSQALEEVVVKTALAKEPKGRFSNVRAFAQAFENASQPGTPVSIGANAGYSPSAVPVPVRPGVSAPAIAADPSMGASGLPPKTQSPVSPGESRQAAPPAPPKDWIPFNPPPPKDDEDDPRRRNVESFNRNVAAIPAAPAGGSSWRRRRWMLAAAALLLVVVSSGVLVAFLASRNASQLPSTAAVSKTPGKNQQATNTPRPTAINAQPTIDIQTSQPINVPQGQQASAAASCPDNEQLVGGGYALQAASDAYTADASYPVVSGPWTAAITNNTGQTMMITASAVCLQSAASLGVQIVQSDPTTVADGSTQAATAACPAGEVVTGGGFLTTPASGVVISSEPSASPEGWTIATRATQGALTETAYALCVAKHLANPTHPTQSFQVPKASTQQVSLGCGAGQLLTGGGFSDSDTAGERHTFFFANAPAADKTSWTVSVKNTDPDNARGATIWAVCVMVTL